jgi:hypothetical protein
MTYTIRISDANTVDIIDMEDSTDVWAWFDTHCKMSEKGETLELLKDGRPVETFLNES